MPLQSTDMRGTAPVDRPAADATRRPGLRMLLLDRFQVMCGNRALALAPAERRLAALLAVRRSASRSELAGLLWPDTTELQAQASLRTALWRLRRAHPGLVDRHCDGLTVGHVVSVDVTEFVTAAWQALDSDGELPAIEVLSGAGELLPGWYEDWVIFERERLRQLQLHALEALACRLCARRRYGEAVDAALTAVRLEPLRETATRTLITVHLAEHNVAEAIRWYHIFSRLLTQELGCGPSSALRRLVEQAAASARTDPWLRFTAQQ